MHTYIVAGMRRTGTSMMMRCLKLGGMDIFYDEDLEEQNRKSLTKNGNKYYYEMRCPSERPRDFTQLRGKCMKIMADNCLDVGLDKLKVVFMERNPLSQYLSMEHAMGMVQTQYEIASKRYKELIRRSSMVDSIDVFDYDDVLADPLGTFEQLKQSGWPIDPEKASKGVDPGMKKF